MNSYASPFPEDFVWGVAASAPQIEGAAAEDGKGLSVWDHYARLPGKVRNGDTLGRACDHYHRFREDFALMRELGVKHYRLSLAWPRIFPIGDGAVNARGLDFYRRVFDALGEAGITPWVTLFHWDLPQALEDRGGWASRAAVDAFARYADTVVKAFAPLVKNWITVNEIRCFTSAAYAPGSSKAPGRAEPRRVLNQIHHHALLSHGHGVRAVREHGGAGARVGIAENCDVAVPVTETERDIDAAREWFAERNAALLGTLHRGAYPNDAYDVWVKDTPEAAPGDLELIGARTDFLGLNLYTATYVRAGADGRAEALEFPSHYPRADSVWLNIVPSAMYWAARFSREVYGVDSIYVTENGCGYDEEPAAGGEILDLHRKEYLRAHLREVHRAIADGLPVHGYFLWSFLDNFEWEDGYGRRFGIVHIDFETQRRTPKLSARWYAAVMKENRLV